MNWFNEKGASLGFSIAAALLAAILICALFVSCGRTHSGATGAMSGVGSGLAPTDVGAPLAAPGQGRASTAPTIPLADVLEQIDAYPTPKGVDAARFASLKAELKRLLMKRASGAKSLSIAPTGTMNAVTDLAATSNPGGTQATLTWMEVLPGDYDNDGEVSITDIIPIVIFYGQSTDSGPDDAHKLVVGDADPVIDAGDLGAIASNYGAHLQGYQVWRGHWNGTSTDWETTFRPNTNPVNPDWSADRPSPPPASTRPAYTYTDDISSVADKANVRYKITAYGDGAAGAESNEATMPPPTYFSVSGTVTESGAGLAGVTMTLSPGGLSAPTATDGTYTIPNVPDGAYTLTPARNPYGFEPPSRPIAIVGADATGQDFGGYTGLAHTPWPKFHGDPGNTGQSPYVGIQSDRVRWQCLTGGQVRSSPAIGSDGTVYVGCDDFNLYAIQPADGSVKWICPTGAEVRSSPALGADGTVYVGSNDGYLYAVNPLDGSVRWKTATNTYNCVSPAIGADGTVYLGECAVNPTTGSIEWGQSFNSTISSCAISGDGVLYIGDYAVDGADGSTIWICDEAQWVNSSPATGPDGTVYLASENNYLYAVNPADGAVKWKRLLNAGQVNGLSSPAVASDGTIYVGSFDDSLFAVNPTDGRIKWTYTTQSWVDSSPAIGADGTVYIGSVDGYLYAIGANGSLKWKHPIGSLIMEDGSLRISSPAIGADGTVYIGSRGGSLYAFGP